MASSSQRPYIIYRPPPGWGFWSNFSCVLQGLDHADRHGLVPVIDMERHPTRYNEDEPVDGVTNAWEYYFHQPSSLALAEALDRQPLDNAGDVTGPFSGNYHVVVPPPEVLARGRELVRKYVRLKPDILAKLDAVTPENISKDMLGVHVRGTDMRKKRPPYHPIPSTPETYLEQAKLLDQDFGYSRVFLACDEQETLTLFHEHFGDRLLTLPAHRSTMDQLDDPVDWDYKWLFDGKRHHHRYLLGLEVLLDALLLSRCGHLACGASNVSQAAMYFAAESQIVHPITPLWMCPSVDEVSVGKAYMADAPSLSRTPSAAVLRGQIKELHELLEYAENGRAEAQQNNPEVRHHIEAVASINRESIQLREEIAKLQREKSQLLAKLEKLQGRLQVQAETIKMLKSRISILINRWTRLGWGLMPWSKPSWRKQPFK